MEPNGGMLVLPGLPGRDNSDLIIALAARHRLPAMYTYREFSTSGGLMSYDTDTTDLYQRAASYVDRENEAIDRVAGRFAQSLVTSLLEGF